MPAQGQSWDPHSFPDSQGVHLHSAPLTISAGGDMAPAFHWNTGLTTLVPMRPEPALGGAGGAAFSTDESHSQENSV
jgi:hypothetical protein